MLIVIGGLPAVGKTSIARGVRERIGGLHVRIDALEQAIVDAGIERERLGPAGYAVGYAVTDEALRQRFTVIAECVNPVAASRDHWVTIAGRVGVRCIEVEVVCSDRDEHRRRATTRVLDIPNLPNPSWREIQEREYEPWTRDRVVVDTGVHDLAASVDIVVRAIDTR